MISKEAEYFIGLPLGYVFEWQSRNYHLIPLAKANQFLIALVPMVFISIRQG